MNSSWSSSHAVCFYIPEKLRQTTCFDTLASTAFLNYLQTCNTLQISFCETSLEILFCLKNLPVIHGLCFLTFNHERVKHFSYHFFHVSLIPEEPLWNDAVENENQKFISWPPLCTFSMAAPKDSNRFAKDGFLTTCAAHTQIQVWSCAGEADLVQAAEEPNCWKHNRRYLLQC